ncbi:histidinol-phosphate transaminase [Geoglobus ahangari]
MRSDADRIPEYVPGKSVEEIKRKYGLERVVKLASNENPYGCSPRVLEALRSEFSPNVYPPSDPEELREAISDYIGFESDMVAVSAGMDGVLETVFKMLLEPGDRVCFAVPTFPYYSILSRIYRAREVKVGRGEGWEMRDFDDGAKLMIICSPNNPTGNVEDSEFVRHVVESVKGYVFIDEAYAEFTERQLIRLAEYENVIVGRTFSKAFGLANIRLGYGVMHPEVRKEFMKFNTPFPVSTPAIRAGIAALQDLEWMREAVRRIVEERERLYRELERLATPYPSEANFIYLETGMSSDKLVSELERRGVIVRNLSGFEGAGKNAVRVSIGRREENDLFLSALEEVLCSR